ncbi:MAG: hypothetical protein IT258_00285 [Saprospiraceae bacterium]|nr:hypothetical protein [Saprospiraceae bacterium]
MKQLFNVMLVFIAAVLLPSCEDEKLSLSVTNRLPNIELREVVWKGHYLAGGLLPGETAELEDVCIGGKSDDWPQEGPIEFRMTLNGKVLAAKTKESIKLDCDQHIEFEVNDSTEIEIF